MRSRRQLSLPARVLVAAVVPAALIAIGLAWYFTWTRGADWDRGLHERGLLIARQLASAAEYGAFSGNRAVLAALVAGVAAETDVDAVQVLDALGATLAAAGSGKSLAAPTRRLAGAELLAADSRGQLFAAPIMVAGAGIDEVYAAANEGEAAPPRTLGTVLVRMGYARIERDKRELALSAAAITFAGLLLAGLLARRLSRGATRPVMHLADTVAQIASGNLDARAATQSSGALRVLEHGVNDMAVALADARDGLERRVRDATTELQAQKELAESANRTKTHFLAAASHDLRQPLQALGLFVNALHRHIATPTGLELVERVERAVESLEKVLDALLDISRLDAGVVAPQTADFPLAPLFASLEETFADLARRHALRLRFRPTSAWGRSDPVLLERIVANLIANALRYTVRGSVLVACRVRRDTLCIEVRDSGRGIADADLQRAFREFVQIGERQPGRDKGLGLGLSIVERLGRLLGHRIDVRSAPGRGSVFVVTIARATAQAPAPAAAAPTDAAALAGRRIGVVEDEAEVRAALTQYLQALGAEVVAAADDLQLCAAYAERGDAPAAVITDYRLAADLDGLAAAARLRRRYGEALPIIVVTGESAPSVLATLARSGYPVLHKPVRPADLCARLRQVLGDAGAG